MYILEYMSLSQGYLDAQTYHAHPRLRQQLEGTQSYIDRHFLDPIRKPNHIKSRPWPLRPLNSISSSPSIPYTPIPVPTPNQYPYGTPSNIPSSNPLPFRDIIKSHGFTVPIELISTKESTRFAKRQATFRPPGITHKKAPSDQDTDKSTATFQDFTSLDTKCNCEYMQVRAYPGSSAFFSREV
ncbi:uncharacterized protein RAG0_02115 [Rhynchosporium agropyri]|uniref:Uncharacterized protein n=1 Tax=Rhynchosporium agropyri TaxID=914238 RepID=A0A1E1K078_9HELO|nr:uncharacterized protein RAG0_02115 [Rhynchosporium agropyri]